jgi:transitional endoplasmic reticulum ATPase
VLPEELMLSVFSHLNLLSLANCRYVSKTWRVLANDPILWKTIKNTDIELKIGLGGILNVIKKIDDAIVKPRLMKEEYRRSGIAPEKGLLLYGPPNTGKSTLARKLHEILGCSKENCVYIKPHDVAGRNLNETLENIRALFAPAQRAEEKLRDQSPLYLIIIDEFDEIMPRPSFSMEWRDRIVNSLLGAMDGMQQLNNVLVVGVTSRFDQLDSAVLRAERFGLQIEMSIPDASVRAKILEIHLCNYLENDCISDEVDFQKIVELTNNFTGEDIQYMLKKMLQANLARIKEMDAITINYRDVSNRKISWQDFEKAFEDVSALLRRISALRGSAQNSD